MDITKIEQKIKALEERKKDLLKKESDKQRKLNTRIKILAGAYILHHANNDEASKKRLLAGLNEFVTNPEDRKLFGLEPLPSQEKENKENNLPF